MAFASGTYDIRSRCDTLRECPKCEGGEIREVEETETTYRVSIRTCGFCDGTGCVPKWKAA
jgi:hypothetical protein